VVLQRRDPQKGLTEGSSSTQQSQSGHCPGDPRCTEMVGRPSQSPSALRCNGERASRGSPTRWTTNRSKCCPMRTGLLLALALSVTGCHGRAPSQQGHARPASAEVAPASAVTIDSGVPTSELAGASDELRSTVSAINSILPSALRSAWQAIATVDNRKERLAWLAHDFHAPVFLRAERLDEAWILEQAPDPLHVGILAVRFGDCRALADAKAKVERSGRQNFALPDLTLFRMRARGHSLVFVFSETPMHESVATLLRDTNALLGPDRRCSRQLMPGR
jgi:hypothetical protein